MKLDIKYNGVDFVKYYIKTNNFLKEELKNGTIKKIAMILKAKYTEKEEDIIFEELCVGKLSIRIFNRF